MIRSEKPDDGPRVDQILDAAFGPGRTAKVSERVREHARFNAALSQVADEGGRLIGCCRLYDIAIGGVDALFLGPLAVHPEAQAAGVGQAMVTAALRAAGQARPILLVGQPQFFARFGFVQAPEGKVLMPGPTEARRLQWLHAPDGLTGAVSAPRDAN